MIFETGWYDGGSEGGEERATRGWKSKRGKEREREVGNPLLGVAKVLAFFLPSETPSAEAATRASPIDFYF